MSQQDDAREPDTQAILARRAIFVTTALAAISCSSGDAGRTAISGASTTRAIASSAANPPRPITQANHARKEDWDERMKLAPPLEVAVTIPEPESKELGYVRDAFRRLYRELEDGWINAPVGCAPKDTSCSEGWKTTAALIGRLRDEATPGPCSNPRGTGSAQRSSAHSAFLLGLLIALEAQLGEAARALGDPQSWPSLLKAQAPPSVCLNCAMPEPRSVAEPGGGPLAILFEDGSSALSTSPTAAMNKSLARISSTLVPVMVRGHADPQEQGDKEALSKARAQAILDWLVKNGVAASRLHVAGYAADLPIQTSATADGRAVNRRVDFEEVQARHHK